MNDNRDNNASSSPKLWKAIEEINQPSAAPKVDHGKGLQLFNNDFLSRREFMEWTSGMMAVLGTSACTRGPQEKLIPYTKAPEEIIPGKPLFYATVTSVGSAAIGILVESHMGRPTKVEGNPEHPASLGSTDAFAQASVLELYDPDRAKVLTGDGTVMFWSSFLSSVDTALKANKPSGLRILTESVISPSLADQIGQVLAKYPGSQWHQYEPVNSDWEHEGAKLAFGEALAPRYAFDKAEVVLSLDAEFLLGGPGSVRYTRDFSSMRRADGGRKSLNRLYAVQSSPTLTGSLAEHRLLARASEIEAIAGGIAAAVGVSVQNKPALTPAQQKWVDSVAEDLKAHRGNSIVVAGSWQPPVVHALAHAMNERLGNAGKTVSYGATPEILPVNQSESLRALVADMKASRVETLMILGGNPVYTAPVDLDFAGALELVKTKIHSSLHHNETSLRCQWHVPATQYLEHWSDARTYDGTVSLVQPLIAPLYGGKSPHEMVSVLLGQGNKTGYDSVREYWQKQKGAVGFEAFWRKSLHDGVVAGTQSPDKRVSLKSESGWATVRAATLASEGSLEIMFRPDPTIWDGRFANNGWLQELPKPLTKMTWDNAAILSPATAAKLSLNQKSTDDKDVDVVTLQVGDRKIDAPVFVVPGHPDNAVTVHLGYGRTRAGRLGNATGFNAYSLRSAASPWMEASATLKKTGRKYVIAATHLHYHLEGRDIIRRNTLAEHLKEPKWAAELPHVEGAPHGVDVGTAGGVYAPLAEADYKWGMSINLSTCTGCNACVVACQSENNIPVVGKVEVERGRAMHWLRIDRYYEGPAENPHTHHQPVPCMHCEAAPCEVVCPVNATTHDNEGLNNMVYNRCVGTKYCSNNCPYKVRHFNFYEYQDMQTPTIKMVRNPDVTIRSRGVMEKCSYCVQRISSGRITAKNEKRKIKDGDVKTACQSACPAQAIIFGDIGDPTSLVSQLKADPLNYALLAELNTKPRTTYLAKVRNPKEGMGTES